MDSILHDIRYGMRSILKRPGFTVIVVIALALGIGANTTVFSLLNALLIRPLQVEEPGELISLHDGGSEGNGYHSFSYPAYRDYRERNRSFTDLAAYTGRAFSLSGGGDAERVLGLAVSDNYFRTLGVKPLLGRFFVPDDDSPSTAQPAVVLGYGVWQRRFGADRNIVGRTVNISGHPFQVIGVVAEGFTGTTTGLVPALWITGTIYSQMRPDEEEIFSQRRNRSLEIFGRLKPGMTVEAAQSDVTRIASELGAEYEEDHGTSVWVEPLTGLLPEARDAILSFMMILMIVALLVLLIACVNVASMLLARAVSRRREMAIRLSLGASRGRIIRQLVIESMMLFLMGGGLGVLLAFWGTDLLMLFKPTLDMPIELDLGVDSGVLLFALLLSLVTGLLCGLVPAVQSSRRNLNPMLKESSHGGGRKRSRVRSAFIVAQVSLSFLLLIFAGLFLRTLQQVSSVDPGFNPDGVQVATVDLSLHRYEEEKGREFFRQLLDNVRAMPGVTHAGLTSLVPLGTGNTSISVMTEGQSDENETTGIDFTRATPGYFETMEIPMAAGRTFTAMDRKGSSPVAIINQTMARQYWPGQNALGKRLSVDGPNGTFMDVVGIARDTKVRSVAETPIPFLYLPYEQNYDPSMMLVLRSERSTGDMIAGIRSEVAALDRNLPLLDEMPLVEYIGVALLPQRMAASVSGIFGMLGLVLAGVGIYGLIAYSVVQRTHEIGVRVALGANRRDVLMLVLRQGLLPVAIGLLIGLVGALALARGLEGFLVGTSPTDPLTFAAVALLIGSAALLASYIPARRATRIDPMEALRYE